MRELRCLLTKIIVYCLANTNKCIQECNTKDNDLSTIVNFFPTNDGQPKMFILYAGLVMQD